MLRKGQTGFGEIPYVLLLCNPILVTNTREHCFGNPLIWDNMNGAWGHLAKWNKSDRETLYGTTEMWNLNTGKQKASWWVPRDGGGGRGELGGAI